LFLVGVAVLAFFLSHSAQVGESVCFCAGPALILQTICVGTVAILVELADGLCFFASAASFVVHDYFS
jgi:hypothetical protein